MTSNNSFLLAELAWMEKVFQMRARFESNLLRDVLPVSKPPSTLLDLQNSEAGIQAFLNIKPQEYSGQTENLPTFIATNELQQLEG